MNRRIAITPGDPRGVGPEVALAAASRLRETDPDVELVFVGPARAAVPEGAEHVSVGEWDGSALGAGVVSGDALRAATELACRGDVGAVVTGPVHKPSLDAAGYSGAGQTELLQRFSGAERVAMLMAADRTRLGGPLRVLLATRHVPLREVPDRVTRELLVEQTELLGEALRRWWRLARPRIALCGLNPHASDDGLFGSEEAEVFGPAVEQLRAGGLDVSGPYPADTVFGRAIRGDFDAVVAPYHDVGMAAFKTASFGSGVNVTLGLPFPRTSPDHGTAFDLAGSGRADAGSMHAALDLARRFLS